MPPMTSVAARAAIVLGCDANRDPALTEEELAALVSRAQVADVNGKGPLDDEWIPTYDVTRSVAEGWEARAGKAAARPTIGRRGDTVNRGQVHEALLRMAALWRRRLAGSAAMLSSGAEARLTRLAEVPLANGPDPAPDEDQGRPGTTLAPPSRDPWA